MALAAATVLEVRVSGNDTNGGGFVTGQAGVDFSQQNAKNTTQQGVGTTLSGNGGSITSGATTLKVASITALYSSPQTTLVGDWIKIDSEIMKVTAQNLGTLTLTVTRAQLTTIGASHNDGATVTNISNVSVTDLVTAGTTTLSSATAFWSANAVGSIIYSAGGTASLTGSRHQIISVSTSGAKTTCVVDSSTNLATGTGATMNIGGALASPGQAAAIALVAGQFVWLEAGTYTISSTSSNVATGIVSVTNGTYWQAYSASRGDNAGVALIQVASSGVTSVTVWTSNGVNSVHQNITVDGQSKTAIIGFNSQAGLWLTCIAKNCTANGFNAAGGTYVSCQATGCGGTSGTNYGFSVGQQSTFLYACEAYGNTVGGFGVNGNLTCIRCLSYSNSQSSSDGFQRITNTGGGFIDCVAYGNGRHGFNLGNAGGIGPNICINCVAEGNTNFGWNATSASTWVIYKTCAAYNNNGGGAQTSAAFQQGGGPALILYTSTAFVNAAGNNFALNNVTTGGAMLRAAGFPGTFPRGTSVGFLDIGAVQHQDPAINPVVAMMQAVQNSNTF